MIRFVSISIGASLLIIILLAAKINYQVSEKAISSFNSSIKHEEKKEYDKAIQSLLQNYDANKNSYLFNLRLGWLYYLKGDYSKSKLYYQRSIDLKKNSTEALLAITLPLSKLEDWDVVQSTYKKILRIDTNNFYANLYLGQIYLNKADYVSAKELFGKIYELSPASYDANINLAWTYYYLGKNNEARELFTNVLKLSANDVSATKGLELTR